MTPRRTSPGRAASRTGSGTDARPPAGTGGSLHGLLDDFLVDLDESWSASPHTHKACRTDCLEFFRFLDDAGLDGRRLDRHGVETYFGALYRRENAPATVGRKLAAIRGSQKYTRVTLARLQEVHDRAHPRALATPARGRKERK